MGLTVAIVGVTGLVGKTLLHVLEARRFPISKVFLLAGNKSCGQSFLFRGQSYSVTELHHFDWSSRKVDIAFFTAGNDVSLRYAPIARDNGAIVIDNSSAFRYEPGIPLIVPEVNGDLLRHRVKQGLGSQGLIIANPNCSTIQMMLVLAPIHAAVGIKRVIVSTYQAASGAGRGLIEDLLHGKSAIASIHANVLPQIDDMQENGYSREEMKMLWESRKILNAPDLLLSATAVRVPVLNGHSEAVVIETLKPIPVAEALLCLHDKPGLILVEKGWVTPKEVSGHDDVFVSRIRQDLAFGEYGLSFWIVGDNLRKGAALNAVQIAEIFLDSAIA